MAVNLLEGLLKTPEDVRKEQLLKLREKGLQNAAMIGAGATPFADWGKTTVAALPEQMNKSVRGLMGGLGSLSSALGASPELTQAISRGQYSPEELQAMQQQQTMAGTDQSNIYSVKQAIDKFKAAGNTRAAMAMEQRLEQLQQRNLTRAKEARTEQREIQAASDKSRLVNAQLAQIEQANTDKASQQQALQAVMGEVSPTYLSEGMKNLVTTLDPKDGIALVREAQAKEVAAAKLSSFNKIEARVLGGSTAEKTAVANMSVQDINTRYQSLIRAAKESGLNDRATQLENEREAVLKNKTDIRGIEEDLRKGFRKDAVAMTQREVVDKARQGMKFLETGEGAADIAGIITFMKALDPGSVVREGEFQTAATVGGILDSFKSTFEGYKSGQRLTDAQRQELANAMRVAAEVAANSYNTFHATELDAYTNRGYDGKYIVGEALVAPTLATIATTAGASDNVPDEDVGAMFGETQFKRY
jgi:hypothetical protein